MSLLASLSWIPNGWALSLSFLAILLGYGYSYCKLPRNEHRPPGPEGDQFSLMRECMNKGKAYEFSLNIVKTYGPFASFQVLNRWFYLVSDPKMLREILRSPNFAKTNGTQRAISHVGSILFGLEGEKWRVHRKIIQPAFSPSYLRRSTRIILEKGNKLLDHWTSTSTNEVNVYRAFSALTLDILGEVAYSYDFGNLDVLFKTDDETQIEKSVQALLMGFQRRIALSQFPKFIVNWLVPDYKEFETAASILRGISMEVIKKKQEDRISGKPEKNPKDMDMVDLLLHALEQSRDQGQLSMREIADEIIGFYVAGHETTAHTIVFCCKALCEHPDIQSRLQSEIDEHLTSNCPSHDEIESILPNLTILDAFIKESQRFYPIVPNISRQVVKPDTYLNGYHIPEGAPIFCSIMGASFDADYWDSPNEFVIDRWLAADAKDRDILAFGDGRHRCIGEKLALLEIKVILVLFLKRFTATRVVKETELMHGLSLGYKNGFIVEVIPRTTSESLDSI